MNTIISNIATKWFSYSILRHSPANVKRQFRNLENISIKIAKAEEHLSFNEACIINKLLPTYTNTYNYK